MGSTAPTPILDIYGTGIGAGYSFARRLKTGINYAFQVIDGALNLTDIGFDSSGNVSTAQIDALPGIKYLRTLYDQSGNANHASIASNSIQVFTSSLINGRLAPEINGGEVVFTTSINSVSVFYAAEPLTLGFQNFVLWNPALIRGYGVAGSSGGRGTFVTVNIGVFGTLSNTLVPKVISNLMGPATKLIYTNGGAPSASNVNPAYAMINVDRISRAINPLNGRLGDVLIYTTDKTSDYAAISSEIQTYYGI